MSIAKILNAEKKSLAQKFLSCTLAVINFQNQPPNIDLYRVSQINHASIDLWIIYMEFKENAIDSRHLIY